jgi:amino acid transporter
MEVFGRPGALFYAWIVCLSCLGALNAQMFSTGRLTQAAGALNYLPAFLNAAAGSTADGQRHNHNKKALGGFFSWIYPFPNTTKGPKHPNVCTCAFN